jgi:predicted acyl esterase
MNAGSQHKYLRCITGRHDLPFYTKECVDMQRSFLDAFLKGHDTEGWSTGKPPKVGYKLRIGDVGYNDAEAEKAYPTRYDTAWPIPNTKYTRYYLGPSGDLSTSTPVSTKEEKLSYEALGDLKHPQLFQFTSPAFERETEFTGHVVAHLNVSVTATDSSVTPSDIDIFLTVRHLDAQGKEILYTGTVGDPVPISKGWLRVSLRKVNEKSPRHAEWHPHREYLSTDHAPLVPGEVYPVDVEIWPTNVVMQKGDKLVLEVSSGDTQGAGLFEHTSKEDRPEKVLKGRNHIHFGEGKENWLLMPLVPPREG